MSWARLAGLGVAVCALGAGALGCGESSGESQGGTGAPIMMSGGAGGLSGSAGLAGDSSIGGAGWQPVAGAAGASMGGGTGGGSGGTGAGIGGASGVGGVGGGGGAGTSGGTGSIGGGPPIGGGSGMMSSGGSTAPIPVAEGMPTHLPTPKGTCPDIRTGSVTISLNGASVQFRLWVGSGKGPALIYWHGTGGSSSEASSAMSPAIAAVSASGGLVAAAEVTSATGANTGNFVWYTGDVDFADEVLACGIEQGVVDPARIHVSGYSAGGLQTVYHWYARSGYVASVLSYSGGDSFLNVAPFQNPAWVPPAIAAHGAEGADWLALDFAVASNTWLTNAKNAGGLAIDCNDGGSHVDVFSRFSVADAGWQFFLDHPWGVADPYTSLPAAFPSYCMIKP